MASVKADLAISKAEIATSKAEITLIKSKNLSLQKVTFLKFDLTWIFFILQYDAIWMLKRAVVVFNLLLNYPSLIFFVYRVQENDSMLKASHELRKLGEQIGVSEKSKEQYKLVGLVAYHRLNLTSLSYPFWFNRLLKFKSYASFFRPGKILRKRSSSFVHSWRQLGWLKWVGPKRGRKNTGVDTHTLLIFFNSMLLPHPLN